MATFSATDLTSRPQFQGEFGNAYIGKFTAAVTSSWANADTIRLGIIPAGTEVDAILLSNDALAAAAGNAKVGYSYVDGSAAPSGADNVFSAAGSLSAPFAAASNGIVLNRFAATKLEKDAYLDIVVTSAPTTPAAGSIWATVLGEVKGAK